MNEPIITVEEIKRNARAAFEAGKSVTQCPFSPESEAAEVWCREMHLLELECADDVAG